MSSSGTTTSPSVAPKSNSGNGAGYDFKQTLKFLNVGIYQPATSFLANGDYLREIEGYTCQPPSGTPQASHAGRLFVQGAGWMYQADVCTAAVPASAVDISSYDPEFAARGAQVFKLAPTVGATFYTSIWCRPALSPNTGLDVVIEKYAEGTEPVGATPYRARLIQGLRDALGIYQKSVVIPFPVNRTDPVGGSSFASDVFDFKMDAGSAQSTGNLDALIDNARVRLAMDCRNELKTVALTVNPLVASGRAGTSVAIQYNWIAQPTALPLRVFVHIIDDSGVLYFQGDHQPPTATTAWSGPLTYSQTLNIPATMAPGNYRIMVGLFDNVTPAPVGQRFPLEPGNGVVQDSSGELRYQVGTLQVTP